MRGFIASQTQLVREASRFDRDPSVRQGSRAAAPLCRLRCGRASFPLPHFRRRVFEDTQRLQGVVDVIIINDIGDDDAVNDVSMVNSPEEFRRTGVLLVQNESKQR